MTNIKRIFHGDYYNKDTANFLMSHSNGKKILSVGCGDGSVECLIKQNKKIEIQGLEVTNYKKSKIPVKFYKKKFPFKNKEFDMTSFVYSLHHAKSKDELKQIMKEAIRVSKKNILVLDHIYDNFLDKFFLKLYDYFINKSTNFDIDVTFNYLKEREWLDLFDNLNLRIKTKKYPFNNSIFFKLKV